MLVQYLRRFPQLVSPYSTGSELNSALVDQATFEKACEETLESLSEYFEELIEDCDHLKSADVAYSVSNM